MTRGARFRYSGRRSGTRIEDLRNFLRRGAEPKAASLRGICCRADPGLTPKATGAPVVRPVGASGGRELALSSDMWRGVPSAESLADAICVGAMGVTR